MGDQVNKLIAPSRLGRLDVPVSSAPYKLRSGSETTQHRKTPTEMPSQKLNAVPTQCIQEEEIEDDSLTDMEQEMGKKSHRKPISNISEAIKALKETMTLGKEILREIQKSGNLHRKIKEKVVENVDKIDASALEIQCFLGKTAANYLDHIMDVLQSSNARSSQNDRLSYSSALKKDHVQQQKSMVKTNSKRIEKAKTKVPYPSFVVNSEKINSSAILGKTLKSLVKPSEVKASVTNIRPLGKTRVLIECSTTEDCKKMKEAIAAKKNGYDLVLEERKGTRTYVLLKGVYKETNEEEIVKDIYYQNQKFSESKTVNDFCNNVKVISVRKNRSENLKNILLSASPEMCKLVTSSERISVGYQKVHAEMSVDPLQCMNCLSFGHRAKYCHDTLRCSCCGENHKKEECPVKDQQDKHCCINCKRLPPPKFSNGSGFSRKRTGEESTATGSRAEDDSTGTAVRPELRHNAFSRNCPQLIRYTASLWEKANIALSNIHA